MKATARKIKSIELSAPSRIHCGLLPSAGDHEQRRGGLGVMVDQPRYHLRATPAQTFRVIGAFQDRIERYAQQYFLAHGIQEIDWQIEVTGAPPAHTGLGSGTQLALSTASLLDAARGEEDLLGSDTPVAFGRGGRSLVGSVGYLRGGLIWDPGDERNCNVEDSSQNPNVKIEYCELPQAWCWLLLREQSERGLSGDDENDAFANMPSESLRRRSLINCAEQRLLPAAKRGDFNSFGSALYEFGMGCGEYFQSQQNGTFSSERLGQIVGRLREAGVQGVGQSSWGPTLYGLFETRKSTMAFIERQAWLCDDTLDWTVAATARGGAQKTVLYFDE